MAVVWCDTFVFLTIDGGQPGGNKKYKTKTNKKKKKKHFFGENVPVIKNKA